MKKLVYILTTYPCQSETFIQREITQLEKHGFEITVFAAESCIEESNTRQGANVYYRPSIFSFNAVQAIILTVFRHPLEFLKLIILILRLLVICPKEAAIVFLNFHTICFFSRTVEKLFIQHIHACFLSWPACIGLGVSTLISLPLSIAAHARDIFVESGAINLKAKKARFIVCCTKQGIDHLTKHIDSTYHDKLFLNYHGIESSQICNNFNYHEKKSSEFIIAVGRLVEKKGFHHLVEAFVKVSQKYPRVFLVIIGDGPEKNILKNMIEKKRLSEKVHLAGLLDHSYTMRLMTQADMLIVPSVIDTDGDRDGLPNVILEAFSVGTPVIASNLAGICEAIINEKTGILVKPNSKIDLAVAIEKLLSDKKSASGIIENSKKLLSDNFNIEKNCCKLADIFENSGHYSKKIKIAHIVEGFVGGTKTYLCNVLVRLKDAGFDVTLIYSSNRCDIESSAEIEFLRDSGIKVQIVPMIRAINPVIDIHCLFILVKIFNRERFDIIHTHCSKAGALGRIAAKLAGIKKIYHSSHCFAFLRCGNFFTKKIYILIERVLSGLTTRYIAVSNSDAESAQNYKIFDENKRVIVNNGLPLKCSSEEPCQAISEIREFFGIPAESFVVTTACRLVEYKGLFTFLKVAKLSKSNEIFVIAGDGPLKKKIEKIISATGLSEKVKLLGHIYNMDKLYEISDLVVLCSTMEAQPFVLLEAMRANCAIIASDVEGNKELLANDRGLLIEPKPEKIAKIIDNLLCDNQQRVQLAQNAYEYFCRKHRLEDQVQKLMDIYLDEINVK